MCLKTALKAVKTRIRAGDEGSEWEVHQVHQIDVDESAMVRQDGYRRVS